MNTPEISIIIPVYNAERYIHRCVKSLLIQSFTNFELLLIDDGSTDRSSMICDSYAQNDSRIHAYHKINGGPSSARNMGLNYAKGKYIHFIDADDYVDSVHLKNYIDAGNADIIFQGYRMLSVKGEILRNISTSYLSGGG